MELCLNEDLVKLNLAAYLSTLTPNGEKHLYLKKINCMNV
jgi:hypothetical protein